MSTGKYEKDEAKRERDIEMAKDDKAVTAQEYARLLTTIRSEYVKRCRARQPIVSATEWAQGEAFHVRALSEEYGFKTTVMALRLASPRAKMLYEKFKHKWEK